MAITGSRVSVAVAATALSTADADGSTVLVKNAGSSSIFLGGAAVTIATGYELLAGESVAVQMAATETLYGIVAASTVTAHVLEGRKA
jgi:hypothetical protein